MEICSIVEEEMFPLSGNGAESLQPWLIMTEIVQAEEDHLKN